jgi:serine/threonine-protein kinase
MVGEVIAGRYELEELVGTGGMSSVYRARDRVLERTVALKVLHDKFTDADEHVERFRREARMVAGLSHQNIVTVIDRGEQEGRQYIVFEYVAGENLKQLVRRTGPLSIERALGIAIQVARGLQFAHEKGLIHRDVKPQNVLLNGDGQAKVTDFGIARSLDVNHAGMTVTGTVLGTSNYIAPEQAQGRPVDEHTDVYSLGIVLYELLAGEVPFVGDNFVAVAMLHINEPVPPLAAKRPDVSARLDAAVQRAVAKDPADRFATMADFGRELEACLREARSGEVGEATVVLEPRRRRKPRAAEPAVAPVPRRRSRRWPLAFALLGLAVLAAALAVALTRDRGGTTGASAGNGGAVTLRGVGTWDPPPGDGTEHDELVADATDGNSGTYWETENYHDPLDALGKSGVGLVLEASSSSARRLTVTTDTPGFVARVQSGESATGPFSDVSSEREVGATTTFELDGVRGRYLVLWITQLPPELRAHVNEVTASG